MKIQGYREKYRSTSVNDFCDKEKKKKRNKAQDLDFPPERLTDSPWPQMGVELAIDLLGSFCHFQVHGQIGGDKISLLWTFWPFFMETQSEKNPRTGHQSEMMSTFFSCYYY
jgi:hypothetical protein